MTEGMTTVAVSTNTRDRLRATRFGTRRPKSMEDALVALLDEHERAELRAAFEEIDPDEYQAAQVEDGLVPGVTDYGVEDAILDAQESGKR
ncbi:hypothetical protein [Myceligenerans salitolerans]|uniref:Uncharacterized protein n=1 Tax=Myceligenerans salitolerans TaxID=1230528 RepID=A0ABS3I3W4_9MICO|nr:hypothetical protein [Myceligenerans salitolerans]MBO0607691.1 hypothetical protein [Myceligenerans salitolerans]